MTLLGKIFTVMIFIMSIVFMSMSLMVFATHKNWRLAAYNPDSTKGPLGLKQQKDQREQEIVRLTGEKAKKDPNSRINKSLRAWNC